MTRAASTLIRAEDIEPTDGTYGFDEDEFRLDLRVIESAQLLGKVPCDTSDGCGATCSGSACNSLANNPS